MPLLDRMSAAGVDWSADQPVSPLFMEHIGSYQAKTRLPALLDRVERGEEFVITRQGKPSARLLPVNTTADASVSVADLQAFGKQHRGRLRGLKIRNLINDGRRL